MWFGKGPDPEFLRSKSISDSNKMLLENAVIKTTSFIQMER
jgi:hypothetical protein